MQDIRFALRQLLKSPGFTTVAILTLGLGIGACTAIFTVVNSVLLKPVEYPDSDRIVVVRETNLPQFPDFSVSPANYRDFAAQADAFASSYIVRGQNYILTGQGEPTRLTAQRVTGRYFETLRVQPAHGRAFGPGEDAPGKENVVVLSDAYWQRQFGGSPAAIGQSLMLNGMPHTILGVMPPSFRRGSNLDLWAPMAFTEQQWANRGGHYLTMIARLKDGVTVEQARAQLETLAARLADQYPDTNKNWGVRVLPILEYNTGTLRPTLYALLGAVGFLLLIACANIANLLLARATARQREVSIRAALGAGRWRLVRQLLTESLLLGLIGGLFGVLAGKWGLDALLAFAPSDLPRAAEIVLDQRAIVVSMALALLTGLGFGLAPALQSLKVNLVDALKDGGRGTGDAGRRHWLRSSLVVLEIALALVLLTGAGLLMRSFNRLATTSPGFDPQGALWVSVGLPGGSKYGTPEKQTAAIEDLLGRFRSLPGVTAAGVSHVMPFSGSDYVLGLEIEGKSVPQSELPSTNYFAISPGYFKAMGIPLIRGRDFTPADRAGAPGVLIISQSLAEQFFPGQDPIGKRISVTNGGTVWREIVGVVGNVKHRSIDSITQPQTYEPILQAPFTGLNFAVRAAGDVTALTPALRREVYAMDPGQPVSRIEPLTQLVATSMASQRFTLTLFVVFSVLALVLASLGIYGVMAYAVSQRTGEFGIRLALGAKRADVLGLVLRHGLRLIVLGVVAGTAGALAAARLIQSILYETSARDPLVLAAIAVLLAAVAVAACLIPAFRATRVDPMVALRSE